MRIRSFILSSIIYAAASLLLLVHVAAGEGFYESWDTARYIVIYLLVSALYFTNTGLARGFKGGSFIAAGMLSSIIFSLGVMLVRLNGVLLDAAGPVKIQRIYYASVLLIFMFAATALAVKNTALAVKALREKQEGVGRAFYLTFHYVALVPFIAYELIKAGKPGSCMIIAIAAAVISVLFAVVRNKAASAALKYLWEPRRFLALVFVFALAARVMFAFQLTNNLPEGFMEGPDTQEIHDESVELSRNWDILDGKPVFLNQKGSAVIFYAVIYKALGTNPLYGRLADALLGALCVIMAFYIANKLFGRDAARIAALLGAGYGYLIQYGVYIGTESIGLFSLMLFVCGVIAAGESSAIKANAFAAVSGLGLAVCVMARSEYYYAIVPSLLWAAWSMRKQKTAIASLIVSFGLLAALWSWRNMIAFGDFTISHLLSPAFKDEWLGHLWQFEKNRFAEAGIAVTGVGNMFAQLLLHPETAFGILMPHITKGFYSFWDYNVFFTPAFIFLEPKNSFYNMTLCLYLYMFMLLGMFVKPDRRAASLFLAFIIIFKTISYIFTTTPTFYENGAVTALFKDWYRFTMIPFTHVFMGAGIAWLISKARDAKTGKAKA
ncbi:MAG: glycosyltransferase family 39 protein [Candidatus Omnitrophica bacterium]|nr:glycosyltransferase family 39 protein [Candidatus Omnitrophota bacterium]MDD5736869.1 glycosyltransferase family 39 protein [Candidatus Omnitrophota bacterium]